MVAFQEERGTIRGSPPPPKKNCTSSSYSARPTTRQYNIDINKTPFPKDACKAQNTIQKIKTNQIKKQIPENANKTVQNWKGHDNMDISFQLSFEGVQA